MCSSVSGFCWSLGETGRLYWKMNSYKYIKRMGSLELLFPGYGGSQAVFVRPLCYQAIEISVHNIELAPISNSRF